MKHLSVILFLFINLVLIISWVAYDSNDKNKAAKAEVVIEELPLVPLKAGSVKASGWMLDQMQRDIETG